MNAENGKQNATLRAKISTLWIVVMVNVAMADIFGFMMLGVMNGADSATAFEITQGIMLIFAIIMEIPIAMIFLSRILNAKASRLVNIIAVSITTIFIVAGGSMYLHYYFFGAIEVVSMIFIVKYAVQLNRQES